MIFFSDIFFDFVDTCICKQLSRTGTTIVHKNDLNSDLRCTFKLCLIEIYNIKIDANSAKSKFLFQITCLFLYVLRLFYGCALIQRFWVPTNRARGEILHTLHSCVNTGKESSKQSSNMISCKNLYHKDCCPVPTW